MNKTKMKIKAKANQNGVCALSGTPLPSHPAMYDADRILDRANGGELVLDNIKISSVNSHIEKHGNTYKKDDRYKNLKLLVRDRNNIVKAGTRANNQLLAYKRSHEYDFKPSTFSTFIEELAASELEITPDQINWENVPPSRARTLKYLFNVVKENKKERVAYDKDLKNELMKIDDPLIHVALAVESVGVVTVAYTSAYIDLFGNHEKFLRDNTGQLTDTPNPRFGTTKARHPSSLWSYVGWDTPSYKRYLPGQKGGGNRNLRTALYAFGISQILKKGPYTPWHYNHITKLESSDKTTMTRLPGKKGLHEMKWKDVPKKHRWDSGIRIMGKMFLFDWWYVGHTLYGLPTEPCYAEVHLGGNHRTSLPEERGWVY